MLKRKWAWGSLAVSMLLAGMTVFLGMASAVTPTNVVKIARVTGATKSGETIPNPNQTHSQYQVEGTDLGIMWDKGGGEVFVLFGDTFGPGWCGDGGCGSGWRSNVLAKSSDTNLSDGMTFSTMIQDTPGHAKEILASKKINNDEITVIPTAGVTVGSRHYIHYMSVNHWGDPGKWYTNYAGIAYSDDDGQTWTKHPTARWQNNANWSSKFQMAAFVKDGGFVYMYATSNGRYGSVYLARVPEGDMLSIGSYRYWDGLGWNASEAAAAPVAIGIAGEMSVMYNTYFNRFIMTYLNPYTEALVMRDAATPTGPWSGEKIILRGSDYPGMYGSFMHPWSSGGTDLYFVMSEWGPYNTFLMKTTLTSDSFGSNLISEPGFETQAATTYMAPWYATGNAGVDRNAGQARTGQDNGFVRYNSGWNALKQSVAVQPYTDYTLKGWIRTSGNNTAGYFGARGPGNGPIAGESHFASLPNYTEITVNFNSGANAVLEIYAGMWADGDTWIQLDDVSLVRGPQLVGQSGFEQQPSSTPTSPWYANGNAGIDRNLGFAHTGSNNAWARNTSGWNALKQEIAVEPNSSYTLTGWIRTSASHGDGYFGARAAGNGPILNEVHLTQAYGSYAEQSVTFNTGNRHSVEIYAGFWAHDVDTWMRMDDIRVTKN